MNRGIGVLALTLGAVLPRGSLAQEPKAETKNVPGAAEAEVIALEQRALQAFVHGDPAELMAATGPSFVCVTPGGSMIFTADTAAMFMNACRTTAFTGSDYRATPSGADIVTVTYQARIEQLCGDRHSASGWQAMTVWQRRSGRWQVVAWSHSPPPPPTGLTTEARAAIEAQVRSAMQGFSEATKRTDAEAMVAFSAREDGLCVFGAAGGKAFRCSEIWDLFRKAWSDATPNRQVRQEQDNEEIRVAVISPTVAVASWTMTEDRAYGKDGTVVFRAPIAEFYVFVLEGGQWRIHSGEQAAWPKP